MPLPPSMKLAIESPEDAVAAVPYLLGFHPTDSLVVIGLDGQHGTMVSRADLPAPETAGAAEALAHHFCVALSNSGTARVLALGYGPENKVTDPLQALRSALADQGLPLIGALRVDAGRWWSLTCSEDCCPAEGTPLPPISDIDVHAMVQGATALSSHDELNASIAPLEGARRAAMQAATRRAEERLRRWTAEAVDQAALRARITAAGLPWLDAFFRRAQTQDGQLGDDEAAWLSVLLTSSRLRDEAMARLALAEKDAFPRLMELWKNVLRRSEEPYAAAPACFLAYAAYAYGDGALANVALDRALQADPACTLAATLRSVFNTGIPPAVLREWTPSPEELAADHDQEEPVSD